MSTPTSATHTTAIVKAKSYDEELLFRLVTCTSGTDLYLGIVEDVRIVADESPTIPLGTLARLTGMAPSTQKLLTIRNLLCVRGNAQAVSVRNAPRIGSAVSFASEDQLNRYFPKEEFPKKGYLGKVRGTGFPLPLDLDKLCFGNTAILAGIGHGKSHLGALVASQLYLMGKKVIVVDPSGGWRETAKKTEEKMAAAHIGISWSSFDTSGFLDPWKIEASVSAVCDYLFKTPAAALVILDVSFPTLVPPGAEFKLEKRCDIVYGIQQELMGRALHNFASSGLPYGLQTCVVLDEAHEFVPYKPNIEAQAEVATLFSISSKEYRKFGLGHIFIDQSLKAISEDLQIQTFLLGATTTPADLSFLESRLGKEVISAAQRTIGGTDTPSWVAYGAATPMNGIPWEIETFKPKELSILSK